MGDGDYMYAFQQVVMPIAQEFNPDLVISRWLSLNIGILLTCYSCLWFWCCCWWWTWRLFCDTILLCAHDAYAYGSCQWQGICLSRGWSLTTLLVQLILTSYRVVTISDLSPSQHLQSPGLLWESHRIVSSQHHHRSLQQLQRDESSWPSLVTGDACIRRNHKN